jgi:hypothetical protein
MSAQRVRVHRKQHGALFSARSFPARHTDWPTIMAKVAAGGPRNAMHMKRAGRARAGKVAAPVQQTGGICNVFRMCIYLSVHGQDTPTHSPPTNRVAATLPDV